MRLPSGKNGLGALHSDYAGWSCNARRTWPSAFRATVCARRRTHCLGGSLTRCRPPVLSLRLVQNTGSTSRRWHPQRLGGSYRRPRAIVPSVPPPASPAAREAARTQARAQAASRASFRPAGSPTAAEHERARRRARRRGEAGRAQARRAEHGTVWGRPRHRSRGLLEQAGAQDPRRRCLGGVTPAAVRSGISSRVGAREARRDRHVHRITSVSGPAAG
jgi:hypothetical protein